MLPGLAPDGRLSGWDVLHFLKLSSQGIEIAARGELAAVARHHFDTWPEVRGDRGFAPSRRGHGHAVALMDESSEVVAQRFARWPEVADDLGDLLLQRHQLTADRLGQGAEHLLGLFGAEPWNSPFDLGRGERLRKVGRQPQRDAVPFLPGRVGIEQRDGAVVELHRVGKGVGVEVDRLIADEVLLRGLERLAIGGLAEPAVQFVAGRDVLQMLRVEFAEHFVEVADVVTADTGLPALDLLPDAAVVGEEWVLASSR